jgi:hypothetical protein
LRLNQIFGITAATALTLAPTGAMAETETSVTETAPTAETVVTAEPETVEVTRWVLPGASDAEAFVVKALQDRGITDRYAIGTVLGNIKQESMFITNICEGGARVPYNQCHRGGYGLIQWTTIDRYQGLGRYASARGLDPSSIHAQVGWMFEEMQWKRFEPALKTSGKSVGYYMDGAYGWLGWGIEGPRMSYSRSYASKLQQKTFTILNE